MRIKDKDGQVLTVGKMLNLLWAEVENTYFDRSAIERYMAALNEVDRELKNWVERKPEVVRTGGGVLRYEPE